MDAVATVSDTFLESLTREFVVALANKPALVAEFARLAKRAARIGAPAITWTFGAVVQREVDVRVVTDEGESDIASPGVVTHRTRLVPFVHLTLTGSRPKIAGWEFAATVQHVDGVNILRSCLPGEDRPIPDTYRTRGSVCDHCGLDRDRRDTYLVVSEAGDWKQVGSSCLVDFFGHEDPHALAAYAEILASAIALADGAGSDEGGGYGFGGSGPWALVEYLGCVAAEIRESGWVPKASVPDKPNLATANQAKDRMAPARDAKPRDRSVLAVDVAVATAAYEWALALGGGAERLNDYLWNLHAVAKSGVAEWRTFGLAASLVAAYTKAEARRRERADRKPSEHVGTVGESRSFALTLDRHFSFETEWGWVHRFLFRDADDCVFTWKASGDSSVIGLSEPDNKMVEGETYVLTASVKKHDEYKGTKQTVLTRAAVRPHDATAFQAMRDEEVRKVLGKKVRGKTATAEEAEQFRALDAAARAAAKGARAKLTPFLTFATTVRTAVVNGGWDTFERTVVDVGNGIEVDYDAGRLANGQENPSVNVRVHGRWEGQFHGKDALDKARKCVAEKRAAGGGQ
jgi:hypothetical protein